MERWPGSSTSIHETGWGYQHSDRASISLSLQQLHGRLTTLGSAWLGSLCFSSGPASLPHLEREQVIMPRDPASSYCCTWILPGQAVSWILYNNVFKKELIWAEMTVLILSYFNINPTSLLHSKDF